MRFGVLFPMKCWDCGGLMLLVQGPYGSLYVCPRCNDRPRVPEDLR